MYANELISILGELVTNTTVSRQIGTVIMDTEFVFSKTN